MRFDFVNQLFPKNSSARHVLQLAGGTAFAQGLAILASPILTRLYGPQDFGTLTLFTAILGTLTAFTGLNYHLPLPMVRDNRVAANLLALSLAIQAILAFSLGIILHSFGNMIFSSLKWEILIPYKAWCPIGVFLIGSYSILSYYATREKAFGEISHTKVTQGFLNVGVSLLCGFLKLRPLGLLLGQITGQAGGISGLTRKTVKKESLRLISFRGITEAAFEYRRFPVYQTWGTLCNILSVQLPPLLLTSFLGATVTGWFGFSMRILQLPISLIGAAVAQVFYPRAGEIGGGEALAELIEKTVVQMANFLMTPLLFLIVLAPSLFRFVFGPEWEMAGYYTRYLAPFIFMQFLASPVSTVFFVLEKQGMLVAFQTGMLLLRACALWLGGFSGGSHLPILFFGAASFLLYLSYLALIFKITGLPSTHAIKVLLRPFLKTFCFLAPLIALRFFGCPIALEYGYSFITLLLFAVLLIRKKLV
jgi:O-antigen/teichoic acid export membrane protein